MDLEINYDPLTVGFDLDAGVDLATDSALRAAVMVSLFTDRRAGAEDRLPTADSDRRGWWADAWPAVERDLIGSRLWLLEREKQTVDVPPRARAYAEEALGWLIEDGIATAVAVTAAWVRAGVLGLQVMITLAAAGRFQDVFEVIVEEAS